MSIDLVNPPPGYEVIDYLGGGAMGDVYLARQVSLGRQVALKVSKRNIDRELHTTLDRMLEEALTIARLDHPNIVPVYDCISHDSRVFLVMKYVAGFTLADMLKEQREEFGHPPYSLFFKHGKLRREAVIEIGIRVAEALAYSHERGIFHRDIKPSNIFVDRKGRIVLIDFGIARDTSRQGMTATGVVLGTPHYMSPEQIRGMALDGRSDLYALGCVLYHCLTGRVPYNDTNEVMVCIKHLNDPLQGIDTIVHDIDPALNAIVVSLLEKDRENRMQSAEELAAHLASIQPGSSDSMRAASILHGLDKRSTTSATVPRTVTTGSSESQRSLSAGTAERPPRRLFRRVAIGALAFIILMALLVELAERPQLNLPVDLSVLKRENWLVPLIANTATSPHAAADAPLSAGIPGQANETGNLHGSESDAGEESLEESSSFEVAVAMPRPRETTVNEEVPPVAPTPAPTVTPEPTPVPLWMAVPPPDGLVVNQEGWQPFIDWLSPRGQQFDLVRPTLASGMELIGDHLYIKLENPLDQDLEIAFVASVRITETTVPRTPFGLRREDPIERTVHRGSPFRDFEDGGVLRDGKRIVLPANGMLAVPLVPVVSGDRPVLSTKVEVSSLVVAGRGTRRSFDSTADAATSTPSPDLLKATRNLLDGTPVSAHLDATSFGANEALRETIVAQTRLVLPPAPPNPARAEALAENAAAGNIMDFLLAVDESARDGSQLLPSLITNQRLEATINGGVELVLTLETEPGDMLVSAVILSGSQAATISHRDGATRQAIRPLAGMIVSGHSVRLATRGDTVRIPLVRWTMQPGQEAVLQSRFDIKTLAVLLHSAHSLEMKDQPPRFRRFTNLEASR